ncbi:unnamed protein product [Phaeothamnion confervicola]
MQAHRKTCRRRAAKRSLRFRLALLLWGLGLQLSSSRATEGDNVREVEWLYSMELERQERIKLEDANARDNGPKEISIYCETKPQVRISDLGREAVDAGGGGAAIGGGGQLPTLEMNCEGMRP